MLPVAMSCLTSRSHQWGRHSVTLTAAPPLVGGACNATSFPVESRFCCQSQHTLLCFQAPCRKLLNSALRGLELTVIQSDRDIYIPNCNTHGFYRKKQVGSPDRHPPILRHILSTHPTPLLLLLCWGRSAAPPRARSVATAGVWTNWERRCPPVVAATLSRVTESDGWTPSLSGAEERWKIPGQALPAENTSSFV